MTIVQNASQQLLPSQDGSKMQPLQETTSTEDQFETECECQPYFVNLTALPPSQLEHLREMGLISASVGSAAAEDDGIQLLREKHLEFLQQVWKTTDSSSVDGENHHLRSSFTSLDSSRTWMLFWCLQACDLMGLAWSAVDDGNSNNNNNNTDESEVELYANMVDWLKHCWTPVEISRSKFQTSDLENDAILVASCKKNDGNTLQGGGFGGGPGQIPHAATTYAAVMCLLILGTSTSGGGDDDSSEAATAVRTAAMSLLESIRQPLYVWMKSLLVHTGTSSAGAFCMHDDGEMDVRATYCVLAVAKLLNLLSSSSDDDEESFRLYNEHTVPFLLSCQTFEGGFGGEPYNEAHGGYTYCATAALQILGYWRSSSSSSSSSSSRANGGTCTSSANHCVMNALTAWLAARQKSYEGGLDGRTNKLVDGCYSFWQGASMAICSMYHHYNQQQQNHGQQTQEKGKDDDDESGIEDDPWLSREATTSRPELLLDDGMLERYILLCSQDVQGGLRDKPSKRRDFYHSCYCLSGLSIAQHNGCHQSSTSGSNSSVPSFGHASASLVAATHPLYNLRLERARQVLQHFHAMGAPTGGAQK